MRETFFVVNLVKNEIWGGNGGIWGGFGGILLMTGDY